MDSQSRTSFGSPFTHPPLVSMMCVSPSCCSLGKQLNFKVPTACSTVCRKVLTKKEKGQFIKAIREDYRVHW